MASILPTASSVANTCTCINYTQVSAGHFNSLTLWLTCSGTKYITFAPCSHPFLCTLNSHVFRISPPSVFEITCAWLTFPVALYYSFVYLSGKVQAPVKLCLSQRQIANHSTKCHVLCLTIAGASQLGTKCTAVQATHPAVNVIPCN